MLNIENDSFRSIIVAGGLTFVILAGLAMNMGEDEAGAEILMEEITGKVLSTSLPTNLPAILSIGLGEGLAGFFGTFFVYFTSGRKRVSNDGTLMSSEGDDDFIEILNRDADAVGETYFNQVKSAVASKNEAGVVPWKGGRSQRKL